MRFVIKMIMFQHVQHVSILELRCKKRNIFEYLTKIIEICKIFLRSITFDVYINKNESAKIEFFVRDFVEVFIVRWQLVFVS